MSVAARLRIVPSAAMKPTSLLKLKMPFCQAQDTPSENLVLANVEGVRPEITWIEP